MRLAVHAGCFSRPKLLPTTYHPSPSGLVASGVVRFCPVFAPVVVSTSDGSSPPLEMNLPPLTLCRKRSTCGTTFGPVRMNDLLPAILMTALPTRLSRATFTGRGDAAIRRPVRSGSGYASRPVRAGPARAAQPAQPDREGGHLRGGDTARPSDRSVGRLPCRRRPRRRRPHHRRLLRGLAGRPRAPALHGP